ncbi:hypothetical protein BDV93DRAFT_513595 [Ceratobasidium sp. AG-I]|nr:hypothetical protein BDV93DRAFT_513595 [Ceratobasidium sp. AG-I]
MPPSKSNRSCVTAPIIPENDGHPSDHEDAIWWLSNLILAIVTHIKGGTHVRLIFPDGSKKIWKILDKKELSSGLEKAMKCGNLPTDDATHHDFLDIQSKIRNDTHARLGRNLRLWSQVSLEDKLAIVTAALAAFPYLHRFENNWAALEIMKRVLRNKRNTTNNKKDRRGQGKATQPRRRGSKDKGKGKERQARVDEPEAQPTRSRLPPSNPPDNNIEEEDWEEVPMEEPGPSKPTNKRSKPAAQPEPNIEGEGEDEDENKDKDKGEDEDEDDKDDDLLARRKPHLTRRPMARVTSNDSDDAPTFPTPPTTIRSSSPVSTHKRAPALQDTNHRSPSPQSPSPQSSPPPPPPTTSLTKTKGVSKKRKALDTVPDKPVEKAPKRAQHDRPNGRSTKQVPTPSTVEREDSWGANYEEQVITLEKTVGASKKKGSATQPSKAVSSSDRTDGPSTLKTHGAAPDGSSSKPRAIRPKRRPVPESEPEEDAPAEAPAAKYPFDMLCAFSRRLALIYSRFSFVDSLALSKCTKILQVSPSLSLFQCNLRTQTQLVVYIRTVFNVLGFTHNTLRHCTTIETRDLE